MRNAAAPLVVLATAFLLGGTGYVLYRHEFPAVAKDRVPLEDHPELDVPKFCDAETCISVRVDKQNGRVFFWANPEAYPGMAQYVSAIPPKDLDFTRPATLSGCVVYQDPVPVTE